MNSNTSLDRESFQMFLANAFEVHKSGLNPKSLSALVELQRFIRTDEFTVDRALHLITDHALTVSNASGIAIALLEANQLVYRARSGLAAMDVGRHVPAMLSVCGRKARVEILRVENAQTDLRIEAEICRQFGATSLLIPPIYQAKAVTGVLQVHC
jgi:two-component system, NtrC family, sensor kinase